MMPTVGRPLVKQRPWRQLQVMYLYAGPDRRADLVECLTSLIYAFNLDDSFAFRAHLSATEVDVLRGGAAHD